MSEREWDVIHPCLCCGEPAKFMLAEASPLRERLATAERELVSMVAWVKEETGRQSEWTERARKVAVSALEQLATAERELDEARKDSERLDVLDQEFSYYVRDSDAGDLSWRSVDFSADVTGIKDLRAGIDRSIERSPGQDAAREGGEDE